MKTRKQNTRIGISSLIALLVVSIVSCIIFSFIPAEDKTLEYDIFCDVKDITSTYTLMDYCHEHGIEYSINSGKFTMNNYSIRFTLNKSECTIANNRHMNNLWLLVENDCYDTVKTTKQDDGSTVKSYMLKTWGTNYESCNGTYSTYNMWPALISFIAVILFAILLLQRLCLKPSTKRYEYQSYEHESTTPSD